MRNKAALVTGAARRLGREMTLALAQDGFDVAVHYSGSQAEAMGVVDQAKAMGVNAVALQADLLDSGATKGLVPRAVEALGRPMTLLVNNASIFEYDRIDTASFESWDRHINSNLRAPFFLSQAFAAQALDPELDKGAEPVAQAMILNMIDQRVRKLTPEFATYTLAKAGLWTLTQTTAQALAPKVRVNAIGPGPTLQGERQSAEHFARQRANTVLKRGSDGEDVVTAMRYFLAAKSVTGELICVDGGQNLGWQTPDVLGVE